MLNSLKFLERKKEKKKIWIKMKSLDEYQDNKLLHKQNKQTNINTKKIEIGTNSRFHCKGS